MRKLMGYGLAFGLMLGCGDDGPPGDGDGDAAAAEDAARAAPEDDAAIAEACVHSPYDGREPACDFAPGPDTPRMQPEELPEPRGECPGFTDGAGCVAENNGLTCTFHPEGQEARIARVWLPAEGAGQGPLVLYFYGLLGSADNAVTPFAGYPMPALAPLFEAGGMLVAPRHSSDRNPVSFSQLPWIGALGRDDDARDFELVDEIVACARQELDIDVRRIHVTGLSAGGWMSGQVMTQRSSYIASAALFSGGLEDLGGLEDPSNKFPVAMFNGGANDHVGAHFENEAQSAANLLRTEGHFAMVCNHGGGHSVPAAAAAAAMRFMLDHPYGSVRSEYCDAAPEGFDICALHTAAALGVVPDAETSEAQIASCEARALEAGVEGPGFDADMLACACDRCAGAMQACIDEPDCAAILACAAEQDCLGISCYQPGLCAPVIDAAGGITGAGSQLAVAFADCVGAAACDHCGAPELAD